MRTPPFTVCRAGLYLTSENFEIKNLIYMLEGYEIESFDTNDSNENQHSQKKITHRWSSLN